MRSAKTAWMDHQDDLAAATAFLVSEGRLECCEIHGEVSGGGSDDLSDFWPIAMTERRKGDHGKVPWAAGLKAREFTNLLKEAYEDHAGDECGYCAKVREE